uniref:Uncharacterized protein n=1 Tax=Oryza meridionalis TaxID=40149 RepID=A0A0E0DAF6_9ORYZ
MRDSAASASASPSYVHLLRRRPTPPRNSPTPNSIADQLLHPPPRLILLFPHCSSQPAISSHIRPVFFCAESDLVIQIRGKNIPSVGFFSRAGLKTQDV